MARETAGLVIYVDSTGALKAKADLDGLTAASARAEAATDSLGKATNAFGETQADVDARLRSVAQAYRAELEASEASTKAAYDAAKSSSSVAAAQTAQSAASDKLVQTQNAQMAASSRAVAMQTQYERVLAITAGTEAELNAAEGRLNTLRAAGAITATEYAAAVDRLAKAKLTDAAASAVSAKAEKSGLSSRAGSEIATAGSEILAGNFGRLRRTGAAFANQAGLLSALMTPIGLAFTGVALAIGGTVAAMVAGERETAKYNQALAASGTAGVTTAGQLRDLSNALGAANGSYGDARDIVQALTHAGLASSSMFQMAAQAASDYAVATGTKAADAARMVTELMTGNFGSISKVDQAYQFLTASQQEHIRALVDQGRATDAAREALQLFEDKSASAKDQAVDDAGNIEKAWNAVKGAIGGAVNALKGWGAQQSLADQKTALLAERDRISKPQYVGAGNYIPVNDQAVAAVDQQIATLNQKLVAQGFSQTQAKIKDDAEKNAKTASDYLSKFLTPERIYTNAMEKAFHAKQAALLAPSLTASDKADIESQYSVAVQDAQDALQRALKKHEPKAPGGHKADPLSGMQSLVNSLSVSALKAEGPVGQFLGTVQKLTTAREASIKKGADAGQAEKLFAEGVAIANQRLHEQETQLQQRNKVAMEQFTAALQRQMAVQKQQNDLAIASVGMGSQDTQRQQQLLRIKQQTQERIFELQQRAQQSVLVPGADVDRINQTLVQQIAAVKAYGDERLAEQHRVNDGLDAMQHDWANGLKRTYADLLVKSKDFASMAGQELNNFASGVSDAFVKVATGSESVKKAFGSVIDSMLADALRFIANQAVVKFLGFLQPHDSPSTIGSASGGGIDWGNLAGDVASLFGGGRANGGPVSPYTAYQVNERGTPELLSVGSRTFLMMGAQGGHVTPTQTSRSGGTQIVNNISVHPTSTQRTADQVAMAVSREQQLAMARA